MKDKTKSDETMISIADRRSVYYTTILSHIMSSDGKHLICGLKSGKLALFDIQYIIKQNIDFDDQSIDDQNRQTLEPIRRPQKIVSTDSPVYSLDTIGDKSQFICGSKGQLQGWLLEDNDLIKEWTIHMPSNDCMVNSLVATEDTVFTGCGDNNVYVFDLETHKQRVCLSEHKDYINCVLYSNDKQLLYSGAEDGSVLVWDVRAPKRSVSEIIPHQMSDLSRPSYGKWIGALALVSDNWLVCGGGPHLSLWHLSSMSFATKLETDSTCNVVQSHNDYIISGGNASNLNVWEMNGELKSVIPTSAPNVFSIATHEYNNNDIGIDQLVSAAGMSYRVDICMNCKFKDFELLVF